MIGKFSYRQYHGSISFDEENQLYFGRIDGIQDLVLFDGNNINEIKQAFKESVDEYIVTRREMDSKYSVNSDGFFY